MLDHTWGLPWQRAQNIDNTETKVSDRFSNILFLDMSSGFQNTS